MEDYVEIKSLLNYIINYLDIKPQCKDLYKDFLNKWFELYKAPKNKEVSNRQMRLLLDNYIIPKLGQVPLCDLTPIMLQSFINEYNCSNTRDKLALIINGSLRKAVKLGLLNRNPFDLCEFNHHHKKHHKPLSLEDQDRVFNACRNKLYQAFFVIMVCTGLRIGEFLAIDFTDESIIKNCYFNIDKDVDIITGEVQTTPKTYSSIRVVPFYPEFLVPYIQRLSMAYSQGYRFTYNSIKCYFRKLYKRLKIEANLHSLRHTFTSLCYYCNFKVKLIQKMLGHSSLDVTVNTYTHLFRPGKSIFITYFENFKVWLENRPPNCFYLSV